MHSINLAAILFLSKPEVALLTASRKSETTGWTELP
jgi:hypothetical protein